MKQITLILLFFGLSFPLFSQDENALKEINTQVWSNFTKAFETLDYELFGNIHSEDLVRVGGDSKSVKDKASYISGYENYWKGKQINQTISFRFLERITNGDKASERGIYELIINPNSEKEKNYYGKFHVIHRKENDIWKILVDYDSSENNTINESAYKAASPMDDIKNN